MAFWQDLRFGARKLRQNPAFAATAVLTLSLGIGANTAIFSLLNAVLLRPLPGVSSPGRLVLFADGTLEGRVQADTPEPGALAAYSYPLYGRFAHLELFEGVAAQQSNTTGAVVDNGVPAGPASARCVSTNYFDVLGLRTLLGRTFRSGDDAVLVASYGFWQRQLGGSNSALGARLTINGFPYTVVGVTPPAFTGTKTGTATDFWVPLSMQPQLMRRGSLLAPDDNSWWLLPIGRLKPGVPIERAQAEVNVVVQQFLQGRGARVHVELFSGGQGVWSTRRQLGPSLLLLMGGVGLLLLIACINVSHLLLARAMGRRAEIVLKLALGAGRWRIARQLITEGLLLAVLGGMAGLALGAGCTDGLVRLASTGQTPLVVDTAPDIRVLLFSAALILSTAVVFGLVPLWQVSVTPLGGSLKAMSRGVAGRHGGRALGRALLVSQMALSLLLLAGAGLLTGTLRNLQNVDKGFREEHVLLVSLNSRLTGLTPRQLAPVYERLLEQVETLPVESASLSGDLPLSGSASTTDIALPGRVAAPGEEMEVHVVVATPGYFQTMGMRLLQGRGPGAEDRAGVPPIAIVNEALAKRFFSEGALGRRFRAGGQEGVLTVAGIVRNARMDDLRSEPPPTIYLPAAQSPDFLRTIAVRTSGPPEALVAQVRETVRNTNRSLAINQVATLRQQVDRSLVRERLIATLAVAFGALALILVCVGLYGVLLQSVSQRTAEIGLRMALGAGRGSVQWLILRESLAMVAVGIALGIPASVAASRGMAGLLFGLNPADFRTLVGAAGAMAVVTALASYLPAWRASQADPMTALRHE